MFSYLVVYNRLTGKVSLRQFDDASEAMSERMKAEVGKSADTEVVVLTSDSEETLRRTHARYFFSASQLLEGMSDELRGSVVAQ